ncbi:hypothetical protein SNOG_15865 [Parastagonospora nodorum SN15]|uniref:Zn(2)-C6 fungal-type domain-containing protein n=1 Tax=Phaeosphaeria nodorum (strain SN15 / ATCC MYA-4574 / FGSC 10173) TaxID=321614 RepID=Q0TX46_PHANO|nr:hypothetical protein SNOG_15865 [Parastagonospora nodorum SN15]EAT76703.1 hypothetical protein SNOG_15865 [Parastagonospora nodorum SN15]
MPAVMSMPPQIDRKRRVHAKSRKGCGNCKLRRVKCNYDGGEANLQLSAEGSFQVDFGPSAPTGQVIDFQSSSYKTLHDAHMSGGALISGNKADTRDWPNSTLPGTLFCQASFSTPFPPISVNATMTSMIDEAMQFSFAEADMQT